MLSHSPPILFLDFDGTISERDAIDVLLEAFGDPRWLDIEADWQAGRIGSRQCLREQMALVRATREEIDTLLDSIRVDRGFGELLDTCAHYRVPVHIVSDGFDYCIRRLLSRGGPTVARHQVGICASQLKFEDEGLRVEFPFFPEACAHGCATCKPEVMRSLNHTGATAVFVGDGLSDRYAAAAADLVFAKGKLANYCIDTDLPYVLYEDLGRVAVYLESLLSGQAIDINATAQALEA
jgi:2-hydroxy-3-keto-5-methylthiopentenyl-1-phosphate phosphatase